MRTFSRSPFRRNPDGEDADARQVRVDQVDEDIRRPRWLPKPLGHRKVVWSGLLLLLVVIAFGCWLGVRAFEAKSNLEQARNSAQQAKDALLQGNTEDASQWADDAHSHAQGGTRCDPLAAMEHRRGRAVAGQPLQDRSTDIRRCPRPGSRRIAAFGGCRRSDLSGPVVSRTAVWTYNSSAARNPSSARYRRTPRGLTLLPGQSRTPRIFRFSATLGHELQGADLRNCEVAREYGSRRAARTIDDGRRRPAHILHGFPNQCRSPRHRGTARRIWNSSIRQRHADRGQPGSEH